MNNTQSRLPQGHLLSGVAVEGTSMTDGHHKNDQLGIAKLARDAVITYPIAPQSLSVTDERLTVAARVVQGRDPVLEMIEDGGLPGPVQLGDLAPG
jgi:hypothetical protein